MAIARDGVERVVRDDVALSHRERHDARTCFDAVLVAAKNNAGWAFEKLFGSFAPRIRGYLKAQGAAEPEELTNDVFLAAFRALSTFDGEEAAFVAWLFTIARNKLVDERRKAARRVRTIASETVGQHERTGGDVEDEALVNLGSRWVCDVLSELAPAQRDVLVLRIVADLTIDQIADVVGKRPGAVKALQRRGLAAIRRMLDQPGRTPPVAYERLAD